MGTTVPLRAASATRRDRARVVGRLLLACMRDDAWRSGSPAADAAVMLGRSQVAPAVIEGLTAAAHFHGVAGYVYRMLSRVEGLDREALRDLEALRAGGLHTHLRGVSDLPLLVEALGGAGIPWLVVKGPVLAELHGAPDLRAYSDLDLVVPAAAFGDALGALEHAGARVLARNWWHRLDVLAGEVPLVLPSGTAVDLHWHLLNDRALRRSFTLRMPAMLDRARPVEVLGRSVQTLDPVDTLLHLALHTAMSGGNRLVWLKDVERILLASSPVPAEAVLRARDARLELVTATILDRIAATLGTRVPPDLHDGLRASPVWRAVSAVGRRLPPPERAAPGGSVDRLVSRATRADLRTSGGELAKRAGRWARRRPDHLAETTERLGARDGIGEDAAGRRAFLKAVGRSEGN